MAWSDAARAAAAEARKRHARNLKHGSYNTVFVGREKSGSSAEVPRRLFASALREARKKTPRVGVYRLAMKIALRKSGL